MFCHLLLSSLTGAQQQIHNFVISAQAIPSPLSPATLESCCATAGAILWNKTSTLSARSVKKPSLGSSCRRYLPPSAKFQLKELNKAAVVSCQDFNEQFPQTPSRDETRPSRCTVSSQKRELCLLPACSNSSRYRNPPSQASLEPGKWLCSARKSSWRAVFSGMFTGSPEGVMSVLIR